jgi:hypothetical protein
MMSDIRNGTCGRVGAKRNGSTKLMREVRGRSRVRSCLKLAMLEFFFKTSGTSIESLRFMIKAHSTVSEFG